MKMTVKQFAERVGVNGITAQSFLGLAATLKVGGIEKAESLKTEKKGRPCFQYEVPEAILPPVKVVEPAAEATTVAPADAEPAAVGATEPAAAETVAAGAETAAQ